MQFTLTTMLCALFLLFSTALTAPVLPIFNPNGPVRRDAPAVLASQVAPPPLAGNGATQGIKYLTQSRNFAVASFGG